jgi:hypothetical protein
VGGRHITRTTKCFMREIVSGRLWLGNAGEARDFERLFAAGIAAVVSLAAEEPSLALPRSIIHCHFPIVDGMQAGFGTLVAAIETLASLLKQSVPALVCCSGGMSRSPAVAAAAISLAYGDSIEERLRQIVSGQPHDISPQLWEAIRRVSAGLFDQSRRDRAVTTDELPELAERHERMVES